MRINRIDNTNFKAAVKTGSIMDAIRYSPKTLEDKIELLSSIKKLDQHTPETTIDFVTLVYHKQGKIWIADFYNEENHRYHCFYVKERKSFPDFVKAGINAMKQLSNIEETDDFYKNKKR